MPSDKHGTVAPLAILDCPRVVCRWVLKKGKRNGNSSGNRHSNGEQAERLVLHHFAFRLDEFESRTLDQRLRDCSLFVITRGAKHGENQGLKLLRVDVGFGEELGGTEGELAAIFKREIEA
jgi:hypothetical protein